MEIVSSAFRADTPSMLTERDDEMVDLMLAATHNKVGDRVKTPTGHGHVASVHTNQAFYGVNTRTGMVYFPASQVVDPDHDGDNDGHDTDADVANPMALP